MYIIKGIDKAEGQYLIYHDDGEYACTCIDKETAEEVKATLEKHEAKKVVYKDVPAYKYGCLRATCPDCEYVVDKPITLENYCSFCGQKLDWRDKDDCLV